MNIKKLTAAVLATATSATLTAAVPEITGVTMAQDSTRLVTINYTLSDAPAVVTLDVQTNSVEGGVENWTSIGGEFVWNAQGDVWRSGPLPSGVSQRLKPYVPRQLQRFPRRLLRRA